MWTVGNKKMSPEERFISEVQKLSCKYGVDVEINYTQKTVNFKTDDANLQIIIANELDKLFSNYSC